MTFKSFQRLFILTIATSVLVSVILSPVVVNCVSGNKVSINNAEFMDKTGESTTKLKIKIPMLISQENETETTNTTTTTTTITSETTNTTTTSGLKAWKPLIGQDMYYPFALIFSILGILSTIWMIFFVETSKDRTIRERIIGTMIRLVIMSVFVGLGIHFWLLFEPI
ncbi:MAG: hypothetical protein ACTSR2_12490 [Candidatus Hodarchaeales archaeon]